MPYLYLVWKGAADSDGELYGIRCAQLPNFLQPQTAFGQAYLASSSKPSLLALSDRILIASSYDLSHGIDETWSNIFYGCCQSWPHWIDTGPIPGTGSSWGPCLARWGSGALAVWNGVGNDTRLWSSQYNQAANVWSTQQLTALANTGQPIQSGSSPALVNFNGTLLMVWRGEGGNDDLYYATSTDGAHWQGNRAIPGAASTIAPALTIYNGVPVLCFKGGTNDTGIYTTSYHRDTDSWDPVIRTGPFGTSHGPSLAVFNGELFMCWKGIPGDTDLYWATTNNPRLSQAWTRQTVIANTGSSVGPAAVVY